MLPRHLLLALAAKHGPRCLAIFNADTSLQQVAGSAFMKTKHAGFFAVRLRDVLGIVVTLAVLIWGPLAIPFFATEC